MIKYVYFLFMINNLINFRNFKLFNSTKIIIFLVIFLDILLLCLKNNNKKKYLNKNEKKI